VQRPENWVEHRVPDGQEEQAGPFLYMEVPGRFPTEIKKMYLSKDEKKNPSNSFFPYYNFEPECTSWV
jgi:hypothetical protein